MQINSVLHSLFNESSHLNQASSRKQGNFWV